MLGAILLAFLVTFPYKSYHNITPTGYKSKCYVSFEEAKERVLENKIKTSRDYSSANLPINFPQSPHNVNQWRTKWKGWADFLGKE